MDTSFAKVTGKYAPVLLSLFLFGCADKNAMPEPADKTPAIHVGMTKAEVLKALRHKPKSIQTSPAGEIWHYDNVELAMIPFNFGFRPEFKDYTFNTEGILVNFNETQPAR